LPAHFEDVISPFGTRRIHTGDAVPADLLSRAPSIPNAFSPRRLRPHRYERRAPKYISSGVWPRNAEWGSTRLCCTPGPRGGRPIGGLRDVPLNRRGRLITEN
jgi:hypothetical protein